jgi:hypothetical protein
MYAARFVQYLSLPLIPSNILERVSLDPKDYDLNNGSYWTDQHNHLINAWCQQNICPDMYFAFQCFTGPVDLHQDTGTQIKLNYVLSTGGNQVATEFYADDRTTLLDSHIIEPNRWHMFRANVYHCVRGIETGQTRFAITARVF